MKKVVRLNENDIEKLVKKIIVKETKMINESDLGDFKVLKSSEMCNLSDGYKVGVAELRGKEILVLLDGKNYIAAHGPMMDFFEGKNKKAVCHVAEQLKDELIMKEDYMDDYEANTYMFWQNIETIKEAAEHILSMDKDKVNEILADGHAWALDHIATSADDVEEVYHFLKNREDDYEGDMKKEHGTYNESELFEDVVKNSPNYINFLRSLTKHTKPFNDVWHSKPDGGGSRRNVTHPWTYYLKNGEMLMGHDDTNFPDVLYVDPKIKHITDDPKFLDIFNTIFGENKTRKIWMAEKKWSKIKNLFSDFPEDLGTLMKESVKGRIIHADEFGFTELLPMNEDGGKGACANRGLSKPWLTPDGPKKRSVCVKNASGNVVKVNFGDPNMRIKKSNPERRKSFRARHKCSEKKDRATSGYWSCKFW